MLNTVLLTLQIVLATSGVNSSNCNLLSPPENAGETQAHGVILYIYPRSHDINESYSGCQSQWFYDEDHYRKLSVVHYKKGMAVAYDNINLNGKIGYHCSYKNSALSLVSDKRCPQHHLLRKKTYQAGCYSQSKLNGSGSYETVSAECIYQ